jgi:hypothetical protein
MFCKACGEWVTLRPEDNSGGKAIYSGECKSCGEKYWKEENR